MREARAGATRARCATFLTRRAKPSRLRVAVDPTADISRIEMVDFESAGVPLVRTHVPPPAPPPVPTIPTPAPIVVQHALVPSSPDHLAPRAGRRLKVEATIPPERTLDQALDRLEDDGRAGAGQGGGQQAHVGARSRAHAPRAGARSRADQPAHGIHRPARRGQDRGRARARRDLSLAQRAAQRSSGRDRPLGSRRGLYRPDRSQDARQMQGSARRHPVHR